jgi:hypothetical protein
LKTMPLKMRERSMVSRRALVVLFSFATSRRRV